MDKGIPSRRFSLESFPNLLPPPPPRGILIEIIELPRGREGVAATQKLNPWPLSDAQLRVALPHCCLWLS